MKLFIIILTLLIVNFIVLAQTAQNVQLLDTKLGSEIYTNPPWDPTTDRFGGGWGYTEQSTGKKYYYSGNRRGFAAFNVTNPANIQILPPIPDPEGATHIKTYSSINGNYLYTTPGADIRNDVVIYDISNPEVPTFVNTIPVGSGSDIKKVHDLYIEDGVLYLACLDNDGSTGDDTPQLFMFSLDNPENPVKIGEWVVPRYILPNENYYGPYPDERKYDVPSIGEVYVKDNRIYCAGGSSGIIVATFYDENYGQENWNRLIDEDNTWVITYQMVRRPDESPGFEDYKVNSYRKSN